MMKYEIEGILIFIAETQSGGVASPLAEHRSIIGSD